MTRFTPLRDRVAIRRVAAETRKGLIYIPEQAQQKPQLGEVIAVGEGYIDERGSVVPLRAKPGMKVLVGKYAGSDIRLGAEGQITLRAYELVGIARKADSSARIT